MTRPSYFTRATFRFLRELATHNNRSWFNANKQRYEDVVREPFVRLITDMQMPLVRISAHYRADPRTQGGSLFRIHRDTRFRKDKRPYKTWASARFFHERRREVAAPSFYLHIEPHGCFVGAGLWHPESPTLKRIREFLADNPAAWKRAVHRKAFQSRFALWGEQLTRPPRGYDP
ncbi:MAG: TIGR02453 family protein, partial [Rhodanobacteraceae bacterium]